MTLSTPGQPNPRLQRGLGLDALAAAKCEVDLLGGSAVTGAAGGEKVLALLALAHLLLHGDHGLLLGPAQGEGDADEEGGDGDGPHGAAGEEGDALDGVLGGQVLAEEPGAGRGRDDVAERPEPVGQGLVCGVEVGVVGDFGVCNCGRGRGCWSAGWRGRGTRRDAVGMGVCEAAAVG